MKMEHVLHVLPPAAIDLAKQDWKRDPGTWRARFKERETGSLQAEHEVADTLEAYFRKLPQW